MEPCGLQSAASPCGLASAIAQIAEKRRDLHLAPSPYGPRRAYAGTGELGTFYGRSFCPKCGSRVVNMSEEEAEIMIGSLNEAPSTLLPRYELWIDPREHWLAPVPGIEQHAHDRE